MPVDLLCDVPVVRRRSGAGERLTIAFDKAGQKKVMASFVVPPEQVD